MKTAAERYNDRIAETNRRMKPFRDEAMKKLDEIKSRRELKFRVWNGMEMIHDVTVGKFGVFYVNPEKGDGLNPEDTACLTMNTTKYHDSTPLMQFTGMLDKNKVEIYEDDVVRILYTDWPSKPGDDERTLAQYLTDIAMIGVVEFNGERFSVKMTSKKYDDFYCASIMPGKYGYIEVIGNIYQNPELLSETKAV